MLIKQHIKFEFKLQFNVYYSFGNSYYQNPITHVQFFLNDCYGYVRRAGSPIQYFESLENKYGEWGGGLNGLDLSVDIEKKLVYISELFFGYNYEDIMTEDEFDIKCDEMGYLELYRNNIIESAVMTIENFIHLLTVWGKLLDTMSPFVLLYLDDKDWYDLLAFDSQEAMEEFVADHTK